MVWGLGVGYVISGNYFGWNLGLEQGGSLGLAIATGVVIIMYVTFTFSYAELSCAIPKAGGAFDYASRALGEDAGFIAGMAQNIEFIFAPPAIAFAIGSYMNLFFPSLPVIFFSIASYLIFTALNTYGLQAAAIFELFVTAIAVTGLLLFAGVMIPHVEWTHLSSNSLPNGIPGIFAAVPFAIWFFLGIEGVANLAEETQNPKRTMSIGFLSALFTLIGVCFLTFIASVGVGGWEAVIYQPDGTTSDSPLPMAMQHVSGSNGWIYKTLIIVGLFGLVASFNGLMLAAGRATSEFGKVKLKSSFLGKIHPRFKTPANALVINMLIGIVALFTGRTGEVITISVFGALTLYSISMVSVIALRRKEPGLERPFQVPFYPIFPIVALILAIIALGAVAVYNPMLCLLYLLILGLCFGIFKLSNRSKSEKIA
ncbi:MAG: ethanolamine permease [Cyclobacteriaceae bacterium]|nr:ethanolamine permease [Cyclobacteriaceae bacterium]